MADLPALELARQPATKAEILNALIASDRTAAVFWERFSDAEFFAPLGEAWSPAENLLHLIKSIAPVALALRLPRWLLRLLFGVATAPPRSYAEVAAAYRDFLARGADAGRFAPRRQAPPPDLASRRAEIVRRRAVVAARLAVAIARWSERDLDRLRLPHPLMGRIPVREMLYFTLDHDLHHPRNVARKLGLLSP